MFLSCPLSGGYFDDGAEDAAVGRAAQEEFDDAQGDERFAAVGFNGD